MEDKYKFFRLVLCFAKEALRTLLTRLSWLRFVISSGVLSAMSAMVNLEVPWLNIMSKMDLVTSNVEDKGSGRNGIRTRKDIAR